MLEQEAPVERIDPQVIDYYIAKIDAMLSVQLDEILHHAEFQTVESLWRSVNYVVDRTDFSANTKIELF